ncbi:BnaC08g26380D [Brassica napus]|uniref:BnaC08g26380D protein n=1 Tax=Brassica napus TaxID=3708 RepID=A0A078HRK0_BRANA|nr:BnaC08g26380D [Brassica napus]
MWLPKLEYGHRRCSEPESEKLQCFLERNLPLHRAPVIESFRLQMLALSHCLRELDVLYEPYPAKPNILPSNLYTCKSLVVLKLDGGILLNVPRMVSLPSLKTLELHEVKYSKGETLQRLLSNCPILEDLVVYLRERDTTTRNLTVVCSIFAEIDILYTQ